MATSGRERLWVREGCYGGGDGYASRWMLASGGRMGGEKSGYEGQGKDRSLDIGTTAGWATAALLLEPPKLLPLAG